MTEQFNAEKFNFVVGFTRKQRPYISCFTCGRDVKYGTSLEAKSIIEHARSQWPNEDWKIFTLVEFVE